ncbi:MAG: trehalase family glycosidase [bacterium]|nr:trehalase family glycosidase [bacterium]
MSLYKLVRETFDEKLPRRTAIIVKEHDFSLSFAYPAEFSSIGYLFDYRENTTYDEQPTFAIRFAEYLSSGNILSKPTFYFETMEYFPSLIRRKIIFSSDGIEIEEKFVQANQPGFLWELTLVGQHHAPFTFEKNIHTVIVFSSLANVKRNNHMLEIKTGEKVIYLTSDFDEYKLYKKIDDFIRKSPAKNVQYGYYLVLTHRMKLLPQEHKTIRFGISTHSKKNASLAFSTKHVQQRLERKWNTWFSSLAHPPFKTEPDKKAYYKCWWVIKTNYYRDKRIGKAVLEALPVYRGYWQWALPAMQWHTSMNPEVNSQCMKRLLDLFLQYQREDGYVTHAIYLDEKIPGEAWSKKSVIQTPHVPWVCLQYYYATKDIYSLRKWYPKLVRYYEYLNKFRDEHFFNLHLWAIICSWDTGLDTIPQFQKVSYGEHGKKELFCYPTIFAAERCRYEQAMGKIAEIIGETNSQDWIRESTITKQQMQAILWDEKKQWYGVLHQNRTLDTRVGVDGLFPFAYNIADSKQAARAKRNFMKLISTYGIYTVAPNETGFHAELYWRGPTWAKSCSLAMATAFYYYPDLLERIKQATVNFILRYPSIWECMNAQTGKIARGDPGLMATPVIASNVGAGELLGAIQTYYGKNVFAI